MRRRDQATEVQGDSGLGAGPQYAGDNPFTARMRFHQRLPGAETLRTSYPERRTTNSGAITFSPLLSSSVRASTSRARSWSSGIPRTRSWPGP